MDHQPAAPSREHAAIRREPAAMRPEPTAMRPEPVEGGIADFHDLSPHQRESGIGELSPHLAYSFVPCVSLPGQLGRSGGITTPPGKIRTPAFVAVGTKASVKAVLPESMAALGAQALLANAYHLYLQPGADVVEAAGGLGRFMNWPGPTFTDSGGFQVMSL